MLKIERKNCVESAYKSKTVLLFKNKILNLPIGSKINIKIPKQILKDKELQKKCMVGIIDTDFNFRKSLSISSMLKGLFLIKDIEAILKQNKIPYNLRVLKEYGRFYIRKEGAIKIIEDWGLSNIKHISKYRILKEFGKFISFSTTHERLAVLEGKLDIEELENICEKRRVSARGSS